MRRLRATAVVLAVSLALVISAAEQRPVFQIRKNGIQPNDPEWHCRNGILNTPPSPALSERPVLVSVCEDAANTNQRTTLVIMIFDVDSRSDAILALSPLRHKKVAVGWSVKRFNLADEGYLGTYRDGSQFEIHFRRGLNVVKVSSNSLHLAKTVAGEVASQLPVK